VLTTIKKAAYGVITAVSLAPQKHNQLPRVHWVIYDFHDAGALAQRLRMKLASERLRMWAMLTS